MNLLNLFLSLISLSLVQVGPALGAKSTATSFCKCICFNNSTIIALNPPPSSTSASAIHNLDMRSPRALAAGGGSDSNRESGKEKEPAAPSRPHHKLTCADCTRAFCLDYNLPICKNARDEDVFTTCFQRDSLKDETVVVIFIFATAGLLAWAIVKPWIDRLREKNTFTPLLQHDRGDRQHYTSNARAQNVQRNSKGPRRAGFGNVGGGEDETGSGIRSGNGNGNGNGNGMGSRRGGQNSANVPYDEDMHADQDAMDIVSGTPSGSGSRP
ncbi:uncharacterized protein A1O5_07815 [Cladophialophora psammophila CBS 110553]|uniref:Uncharacterized protein n=1 Tax=Cladophialophora psammophila CBS 110553 TaxID=1182543 RepID=W9WLZ2_9EURO|nr:uncharacterized protein A1O5_07815 [Cladophialophora psammophila CBS 110553]EXJ68883.1 hypothetical protein A1O5_07815 [Cladophialophora psammophila CBS 110553]